MKVILSFSYFFNVFFSSPLMSPPLLQAALLFISLSLSFLLSFSFFLRFYVCLRLSMYRLALRIAGGHTTGRFLTFFSISMIPEAGEF